MPESLYDCEELAELGGVTRRTVRYYVQRGLLPAPTGTGRGKHYTQAHLDALLRIVALQREGVALADIPEQLTDARARPAASGRRASPDDDRDSEALEQSAWTRVRLGEGVELHVQGGRGLDSDRLSRLARAVRDVLGDDKPSGGKRSA